LTYWKVFCPEKENPGLWTRSFREQSVVIGFPPWADYHLYGETKPWQQTRNCLRNIHPADEIVVHLPGNRVARIGVVTALKVRDRDWNPLVKPSKDRPGGEMGRRLEVRWRADAGPQESDMVVQLRAGLLGGASRYTIGKVSPRQFRQILKVMQDSASWVGLAKRVGHEVMLSDYIVTVPHHLEDGLTALPDKKIRENVFAGGSRSDLLLQDQDEKPVVVECKRGAIEPGHVDQLVRYLKKAKRELGKTPKGFLVHGGARKLADRVRHRLRTARKNGWVIEVLQYEFNVRFASCN
jgi:hypothetical protein